jgi:hypothetical protein
VVAGGEIKATPSKALFIDMMTRDIGIADSILDLVDNAVDKGVEVSGFDAMQVITAPTRPVWPKGRRVHIDYSSNEFVIADTCGGFDIAEARDSVFLLGNPEERGARSGLSVFGIGLKRAIFKLGNSANVDSRTEFERVVVGIDVGSWRNEPDWTFDFQVAATDTESLDPLKRGTTVRVRELHDAVRRRFVDPLFEGELRRRLAATYALFLAAGLKIRLNGEAIETSLPTIGSGSMTPARRKMDLDGVEVLILAGVAPKDDGGSHGWYVFCNGRMVVEADKTSLTGWGDGLPQFHNKYRRFVGFVYFRSDDVRRLPWRTTKQGVDQDSAVYQAALLEMAVQGRAVTSFLNTLYPSDLEADPSVEREVLSRAESITIAQLPREERPFSVALPRIRPKELVSIQYSRPKAQIEKVARHLGGRGMSAKRVGEYTFDFFVEQELD